MPANEALAHAFGPVSLQEDEYRTRDVDRIHAVAACSNPAVLVWLGRANDIESARALSLLGALGGDLWAWKMGRADSFYSRCLGEPRTATKDGFGLIAALMWKENRLDLRPDSATLVARQALAEWHNDKCGVCRGRREIPDVDLMAGQDVKDGATPMKECPACHGTGIRRYEDWERAETLGQHHKRLSRALETAHGLIGAAIREMSRNHSALMRSESY